MTVHDLHEVLGHEVPSGSLLLINGKPITRITFDKTKGTFGTVNISIIDNQIWPKINKEN